MLTLPRLLALIVAINVLIAGILHGWGYDALDRYVYQQKEALYQQALKVSQDTFQDAEPEVWNPLSDELGVRFDTGSIIYTRDSKDVPPKVLDYISDTIGSEGFVDPYEPNVYYPLGENHVFILGPLRLSTWKQYIIEWVTFIASMIGCIGIILYYHSKNTSNLSLIYQRLMQLKSDDDIKFDTTQALAFYQLIDQIHREQSYLQSSIQQHIRSQRDLLHGVAHEFRTPMSRMQFLLEMLQEAESSERDKLIEKLNVSIDELDDLVKELLSYSRIKHLNHRLELELVEVNQMLEQSIAKVASFYPDTQFKFEHGEPVEVMVEDRLMQRALNNILRNAGRFAKQLCLVGIVVEQQRLKIVIEDDGDGIPPGKRQRIFEPFTRLDPSRSRDSGGMGLGLAIVQSIVEQHHGTVMVDDSERLGGACFCVEIPLGQSSFSTNLK